MLVLKVIWMKRWTIKKYGSQTQNQSYFQTSHSKNASICQPKTFSQKRIRHGGANSYKSWYANHSSKSWFWDTLVKAKSISDVVKSQDSHVQTCKSKSSIPNGIIDVKVPTVKPREEFGMAWIFDWRCIFFVGVLFVCQFWKFIENCSEKKNKIVKGLSMFVNIFISVKFLLE